MGRSKIVIKFLEDQKARSRTFKKRNESLKKKAYELSTLCGADTCLICYSEGSNQPITWPEDRSEVERIIKRYLVVSEALRVKKLQHNFAGSHRENTIKSIFPTWDDRLNHWSVPALCELANNLDAKIEMVRKRIKSNRSSIPGNDRRNQQFEVSSCNVDFLYSQAPLAENFIPDPPLHLEEFSDTSHSNSYLDKFIGTNDFSNNFIPHSLIRNEEFSETGCFSNHVENFIHTDDFNNNFVPHSLPYLEEFGDDNKFGDTDNFSSNFMPHLSPQFEEFDNTDNFDMVDLTSSLWSEELQARPTMNLHMPSDLMSKNLQDCERMFLHQQTYQD